MAKYEIEMELQGFKLRVKGERPDDIPHITDQIGRQLTGFLQPPADMIDRQPPKQIESQVVGNRAKNPSDDENKKGNKNRGRGSRRRTSNGDGTPSAPITWHHDPAKWGMPTMDWTAGQKIIWTLYVVSKETGKTEVGGPSIAETFNMQFKQFGPLTKQNMPRDLGNLKAKAPAQVMDNSTARPITWYLTEEGIKEAEKLIAGAKGG